MCTGSYVSQYVCIFVYLFNRYIGSVSYIIYIYIYICPFIFKELIEIEQQHTKDASFASRTTALDLSNDCGSLNRKLESTLFLLTQSQENQKKWQMPQGDLSPGETLRQVT